MQRVTVGEVFHHGSFDLFVIDINLLFTGLVIYTCNSYSLHGIVLFNRSDGHIHTYESAFSLPVSHTHACTHKYTHTHICTHM